MTTIYLGMTTVAERLGVDPDTLRKWRSRYPAFWAPDVRIGATPEPGTPPVYRSVAGYGPGRVPRFRRFTAGSLGHRRHLNTNATAIQHATTDHIGIPELAHHLGTKRNTVWYWYQRWTGDPRAPFPAPDVIVDTTSGRDTPGWHPTRLPQIAQWVFEDHPTARSGHAGGQPVPPPRAAADR